MPTGGQGGRPQRGNAGGGLATALITTADITASPMDPASNIETTESFAFGHGPGRGRLAGVRPVIWLTVTHPASLAGQPGPLRSDS